MRDFSFVSTQIDEVLLRFEIKQHLEKKDKENKKKSKLVMKKSVSTKESNNFSIQHSQTAKVETITIPSSTKKLIITLEA
jgi:hypothetical protein